MSLVCYSQYIAKLFLARLKDDGWSQNDIREKFNEILGIFIEFENKRFEQLHERMNTADTPTKYFLIGLLSHEEYLRELEDDYKKGKFVNLEI